MLFKGAEKVYTLDIKKNELIIIIQALEEFRQSEEYDADAKLEAASMAEFLMNLTKQCK